MTLLMVAAYHGNTQALSNLLEAGADVNQKNGGGK